MCTIMRAPLCCLSLDVNFSEVSYTMSKLYIIRSKKVMFVSGGMFAVPVMLNLFIHALMYSYYFLSSLGKEWQKRIARWKPKLTIAQMVSNGMPS